MAVLSLSERWWGQEDASPQIEAKRSSLQGELLREIGPAHPLYNRIQRVEAFFEATDDVIVGLSDGTFALVHPTWSGKAESAPWPSTTPLGSPLQAAERLQEWESAH